MADDAGVEQTRSTSNETEFATVKQDPVLQKAQQSPSARAETALPSFCRESPLSGQSMYRTSGQAFGAGTDLARVATADTQPTLPSTDADIASHRACQGGCHCTGQASVAHRVSCLIRVLPRQSAVPGSTLTLTTLSLALQLQCPWQVERPGSFLQLLAGV